MKNILLLSAAIAFGILSTAASAEGYYGNAQIASSELKDIDDRGFTAIISGGISLDEFVGMEGFSAEAEFSKSIKALGDSESFGPTSVRSDFNYWAIGAYGAYAHSISNKISIKGRAGLVYLSVSSSASCSGVCSGFNDSDFETSDSEIKFAFGVSAAYAYTDEISIIAEYTKINNLSHTGIGVSMLF